MMEPVQIVGLLLCALTGTFVVVCGRPGRQAVMLSGYGLVLACTFFAFQAPDVALSAIVVGAIALPMMILLTLAKVRDLER
jgi:energy-converting hydrogenase B subunit D